MLLELLLLNLIKKKGIGFAEHVENGYWLLDLL